MNISRDDIPFEKQKELFEEPVNKKDHVFDDLRDKINPNKLIYKFKTEGKSDLTEIKIENPKSKSLEQISAVQNIKALFVLWEDYRTFERLFFFAVWS